jgi:hypothetical protein
MNLSKNFTLEEMTATSSHLPNVPSEEEIANLTELVQHVLQPLRDKFNKPIHVNSGYRSQAVNKDVGGALNPISQHCKGEAADLNTDDNATLFHLIRFFFDYDQLIWEGGNEKQPLWVHVSYKTIGNRKQALKMVIMDRKKIYIEP